MLSSLRILHPPSSDNPTNLPVLVLNIDNKQYLFNAPEGLSRAFLQRGARGATKNLQSLFVPRVSNDACGGLPGFIMSMADQTRASMQLCGPPVLAQLLASARTYTHRSGFRLQIEEVDLESTVDGPSASSSKGNQKLDSAKRPGEVVVQDDDVTIVAVPLLPQDYVLPPSQPRRSPSPSAARRSDRPQQKKQKKSGESSRNRFGATAEVQKHLNTMFADIDAPAPTPQSEAAEGEEAVVAAQKTFRPKPASLALMQAPALEPVTLEEADAADGQAPVLLYIIKNSAKRGRLDAERARQQGLAQVEKLKDLTSGQDVEVMRPKGFTEWDEAQRKEWLSYALNSFRRAKPQSERRRRAPAKEESAETTSKFDGIEMEAHTIRSSDVLAPSIPGTTVAQIYLPSTAYLHSFLDDSVQSNFDELDEDPHVLVHAVHPHVLQDVRYQAFIKRFKTTHHIITTRSFVPDLLAYPSSAMTLLRMSYLDKALFSVPPYSVMPQRKLEEVLGSDYDDTHVQVASPDVTVHLHPRKAPDASPSDVEFDFQGAIDSPEAAAAASYRGPNVPSHNATQNQQRWATYLELVSHLQEEESQREASSMVIDATARAKEIQITTLGTGSSLPSKYRNVSATLLHLPNDGGYVLLDAGEGTYGQLCRKFGADVDRVLGRIRMIFLSHTHGDHHMGMTTLLSKRKQLRDVDGPLFVLSNNFTRNYLLEVNDIQPLDICALEEATTAKKGVIMLDNEHFNYHHGVQADPDAAPRLDGEAALDADLSPTQEGRWCQYVRDEFRRVRQRDKKPTSAQEVARIVASMQAGRRPHRKAAQAQIGRLQKALNGARVYTMDVDHRGSRCYGIVLRQDDANAPWSVAYSGDTRPCLALAAAGAGVEVLIHEATFEDGEEEMADAKGHSTVGQALDIARKMGAKRLLLTHFSQRYPKLPRIFNNGAERAEGGDSTNGKYESDAVMPAVGISFDMMTVSPREIGKTERYREALQVLFEDGEGGGAGDEADAEKDDVTAQEPEATSTATNGVKVASTNGQKQAESAKDSVGEATADVTMNDGVRASGQSHVQRAVVKDYEFVYAVAFLAPMSSKQSDSTTKPTKLSFDDALRRTLEEIHGVVGASFSRDLMLYDDDDEAGVRIVIKVASDFAQTLSSTLAMGVVVDVAAHPNLRFVTKFAGLLNAFDLVAVQGMTVDGGSVGRAWMKQVTSEPK